MSLARARLVDRNFLDALQSMTSDGASIPADAPLRPGSALSAAAALELFRSQAVCRHLDIAARRLKAENEGFYTIGSAGHEGNAVFGRLLRASDPCLLHYRSGALMAERARRAGSKGFIRDVCLSLTAAAEDPVSGGRHKVWGSPDLQVPPQTSTIASHLPRALGMAFALERAKRLGLPLETPADAVVMASFGDASANHSTALGAFNAAMWAAFQRLPVPLLLLCEDNGTGISVPTPKGWLEAQYRSRPGLKYFKADGTDLPALYDAAIEAIAWCREHREPVFFHLEAVRLLGHAGSDSEADYRTQAQIERAESRDPLRATARLLVESGAASAGELGKIYEEIRAEVEREASRAAGRPKLDSVEAIVRPLAPHSAAAVRAEAERADYGAARERLFGGSDPLPENHPKPRHMAMMIGWGLADLMAKYPEMIVFGEDVAKKGGVYHVTANLQRLAGPARVFNTLLDETTIFGIALGAGMTGMLPCPEIQYLAYYHNAQDQVRGEACSQAFFSNGRCRNPMVARIASFAYQKGFGGHFHNDNSIAALRDVPGIVLASPSRADDAVGMLRTAFAMARTDGRVVLMLEPIARYMTKDLHEDRDGLWSFRFPAPGTAVAFGEGRVYAEGAKQDLTIVTYGNGVYLSLRAAKTLREAHGVNARVLDLRWLQPLNRAQIVREVEATGKALIVDECRRTGGLSEPIVKILAEAGGAPFACVHSEDVYVPLGPAAELVLPSEKSIAEAALRLAGA